MPQGAEPVLEIQYSGNKRAAAFGLERESRTQSANVLRAIPALNDGPTQLGRPATRDQIFANTQSVELKTKKQD